MNKETKGNVQHSGHEQIRTALTHEAIAQSFLDSLYFIQGRIESLATKNDLYMALAYAVRDRILSIWIRDLHDLEQVGQDMHIKFVSYLSAEFLPGPHLGNNLINLGIYEEARKALSGLGYDLEELLGQEQEPGLGNGGLGRLASCFMDSLSTLHVPAIGYGIRYEFGIFDQEIRDGWQVEITDKWLGLGNPWEIAHPELSQTVNLGGSTESYYDEHGRYRARWIPGTVIKGVPCDTPVLGYKSKICNTLRLWKAEAIESFDFPQFNVGDYYAAVSEKVFSETISKVLYPNDEPEIGKKLRLAQQYFFVSCSLKDMISMTGLLGSRVDNINERFSVQLNDTHPSIAVAELMRLLIDEHNIDWDKAWRITQDTLGYTNHTLLPEALEKWPLNLFKSILPRHLEIIHEINRRFLDEIRLRYPDNNDKLARLSLIDETKCGYVRMAHLATVGSHAVNGVAELHSELLKKDVLRDFYELWPEKFHNITNGVTPRRWIVVGNPRLVSLITKNIGDRWIKHLEELRRLEPLADNKQFCSEWQLVKQDNKSRLAEIIKERTDMVIDPGSMFDIQVKRIHEYKRQHLKVFHIITLYNRIKRDPGIQIAPRSFIFGGKAAPGYFMAKLIIKLINSVGEVVNNDPDVRGRLKVVFLPNFNVRVAHSVYPAADLSEQISTAGKEASGTGNMKFSMNGALTIGTLDGANVEIRQEVGAENFFLFGMTAEEVHEMKAKGYKPRDYYESNANLREVIDQINSGYFSKKDKNLFNPLVCSLLDCDDYMLLADYQSYVDCQDHVGKVFLDSKNWTRMSILNVARIGKFSSDRSIKEYCEKIWNVKQIMYED